MKKYIYPFALLLGLAAAGCSGKKTQDGEGTAQDSTAQAPAQVVNVYTHRHYDADQKLFADFTAKTGIQVNVVKAEADQLMERLTAEGKDSPADLLVTVDAGRLYQAKQAGLLQPIQSEVIQQNIPAVFRDADNQWFGITVRARVLAYSKARVKPADLSTYAALTAPKWKGKLLVRGSENIYNQSLLAAFIANDGAESAKKWAKGMVANMAREPKGNDRDQVKEIAAGKGDIALVNTYYIGKLLESDQEDERLAGQGVGVFFPDQKGKGAHINISGLGVTKYAPNKDNAVKLIEYLSGAEAQALFASSNCEYPVNPAVEPSELLKSWGAFKADTINFSKLGELNPEAVKVFDEAGWK